jgi:hypothetical protein
MPNQLEYMSPSLNDLIKNELKRLEHSSEEGRDLPKLAQEEANFADIKDSLAKVPPKVLELPDLTIDDLPRSFDLQKLAGWQATFAALNVLENGDDPVQKLSPDELADFYHHQSFFKVLFSNPQAQNLTEGFGDQPGYFFDLLPAEFKQDLSKGGCTFQIDQTFDHPVKAQLWFLEKINQARRNLKMLLK